MILRSVPGHTGVMSRPQLVFHQGQSHEQSEAFQLRLGFKVSFIMPRHNALGLLLLLSFDTWELRQRNFLLTCLEATQIWCIEENDGARNNYI